MSWSRSTESARKQTRARRERQSPGSFGGPIFLQVDESPPFRILFFCRATHPEEAPRRIETVFISLRVSPSSPLPKPRRALHLGCFILCGYLFHGVPLLSFIVLSVNSSYLLYFISRPLPRSETEEFDPNLKLYLNTFFFTWGPIRTRHQVREKTQHTIP